MTYDTLRDDETKIALFARGCEQVLCRTDRGRPTVPEPASKLHV